MFHICKTGRFRPVYNFVTIIFDGVNYFQNGNYCGYFQNGNNHYVRPLVLIPSPPANWVFVSQTRLTQIQLVLVDVSLEVMYAARYYRSSQLLNLTDFSGSTLTSHLLVFYTTHGSTRYNGMYVPPVFVTSDNRLV